MNSYEKKVLKELNDALQTIIDKYVANIDAPNEFISCIIASEEVPWYWVRAKQAIKKAKEYIDKDEN